MAFSFGSPAPVASGGLNLHIGADLEDIQTEVCLSLELPKLDVIVTVVDSRISRVLW